MEYGEKVGTFKKIIEIHQTESERSQDYWQNSVKVCYFYIICFVRVVLLKVNNIMVNIRWWNSVDAFKNMAFVKMKIVCYASRYLMVLQSYIYQIVDIFYRTVFSLAFHYSKVWVYSAILGANLQKKVHFWVKNVPKSTIFRSVGKTCQLYDIVG